MAKTHCLCTLPSYFYLKSVGLSKLSESVLLTHLPKILSIKQAYERQK
jgi:hypothetical protein